MSFPERAAIAETHASTVFFVGDRAYKVKKPVALGFLDFSTRGAREAVCHREVELNRRLARDVYLGVADIIGPDGDLCDHMIVMRRMPDERRLSTLVTSATVTVDDVRSIARTIAAFHASADSSDEISASATRDAVRANWSQSFEQMRPFVGSVLRPEDAARVEELALPYLAGRQALFDARIAEGRVRDGHGDMLADDIFMLDDGPRILDCIEFDDRLRYGDVLNDVAFLAMDLEYQGSRDLAGVLLAYWGELTAETHPASLAHHYIAYRAHVRSKVACLRVEQGDTEATGDANRHLALARRHLEQGRVRLVLVGGLPGSGKSTLAEGIGDRFGWTVLRSDEIRKERADLPVDADAASAFAAGIYSADETARTYGEMLRRARRALELGESVVLDASWTSGPVRADARQVASDTESELYEFRCTVPADVAAYRLGSRARRFGSDATPVIAEAMAERAAPWETARTVDTDRPEADVLADVVSRLRAPVGGDAESEA